MTTPTERLLAARDLLGRRTTTATAMAVALGVSPRTARRYVAALRDLGLPVETVRGPHGGYRLATPSAPGGPVLHLDDDEAVAVAVALSLLAGAGRDDPRGAALDRAPEGADTGARRDWVGPASRAAARLEATLPARARERVAVLRRQLTITRGLVRDVPDPVVPLALADALETGHRVRLRYGDSQGRVTDRDVDPHGLVLHGGRWYLAAWDHLRDDRRTFRLDRVVAVLAQPEAVDDTHELDAPAQVVESVAVAPWRHEVELVVHAPRERVAAHLRPGTAVLTDHGADTRLRIGENHLSVAARLVVDLPWPCTVVRPAELRAVLADLADRLTRAATPGSAS